jgi:hypothetical protein
MGVSAIRYAGLNDALQRLGHRVHDSGNLLFPNLKANRKAIPNSSTSNPSSIRVKN